MDVEKLYEKDKNLKKEDVEKLLDWTNKQPYLPEINELWSILFLHSCLYKNEMAKTVIDNFFTLRTHSTDIFKAQKSLVYTQMDVGLITTLPKETPQGHTVILIRFIDGNPDNFNFPKMIRYFDMMLLLHLHQKGVSEGHVIILDFTNITLTHVLKAGPLNVKKLLFYWQEASPMRLKGLHFLKIVPFMDKVIALIKPFMKKEVFEMLRLHDTVDSLSEFVPLECLPEEYGGSAGSIPVLLDDVKKRLRENDAFFQWEETLVVDERRREEKIISDVLGTDGTFKKLEID